MTLIHATCVEFEGTGVLLRGPSGAGKSDLALRMIDAGWALVADDQVDLAVLGGRLEATPPQALAAAYNKSNHWQGRTTCISQTSFNPSKKTSKKLPRRLDSMSHASVNRSPARN